MIELRPHQIELRDKIKAAHKTHRNVLAQLATGGGKTVVFADALAREQGPSVAIAHRQELVEQMSIAITRCQVPHRIIAPPATIRQIIQAQVRETGTCYYNAQAQCAVAGVDTIIRRGGSLAEWCKSVGLWVVDECFPAGTLVGNRPIEQLKLGDTVMAYNTGTDALEPRKIVRCFKNPSPEILVRLQTKHHVLTCTKGHPLWTKRGWINAGNITKNDSVYALRKADTDNHRKPALSMAKNRPHILLETLRDGASGSSSRPAKRSGKKVCTLYSLRRRNGIDPGRSAPISGRRQGLLQSNMLRSVPRQTLLRDYGRNKPQICLGTDERKQPYAPVGLSPKNVKYTTSQRARPPYPRRKRSTSDRRRSNAPRTPGRVRVYTPVNSAHGRGSRVGPAVSESLQDRLRERGAKNCRRSGWGESLCSGSKRTRCEERSVPNWCRVESVSLLESRDPALHGDGFVYNIEVDEHHTYTANGLVVHNCHHVLRDNKWGTAVQMFPNARGLLVTATPERADGQGLGRHAEGVADVLVEGLPMRELIEEGYLTDYRIFAPTTAIDMSKVTLAANGDYNEAKLAAAVHSSTIIGDVVEKYHQLCPGKTAVVFVPDTQTAIDMAARFNAAGTPAASVGAKTPRLERARIMQQYREGVLRVLVNVDLFGEGFDLPAIEVVILARPTMSRSLAWQQIGRVLRVLLAGPLPTTRDARLRAIANSSKPYGIIIDHVGNTLSPFLGLPDRPRVWTLDSQDRKSRQTPDDVIPLRACLNPECLQVYERIHPECPYCGHHPVPAQRTGPEFVDGDLTELDAETLAMLRGEVAKLDQPIDEYRADLAAKRCPEIGQRAHVKRHAAKQEAQRVLREWMAWWAGHNTAAGRSDAEGYRRFYFAFRIDALSAQALGVAEAEELTTRIQLALESSGR